MMEDNRNCTDPEMEGEDGVEWEEDQHHFPLADDEDIDDVFELPSNHPEQARRRLPPSPHQHRHKRGVVRGRAPSRLAPPLPISGFLGSGVGGRVTHTSIISHLHPGLLDATPTPPTSPRAEGGVLLTLHSLGGGHDSGYVPSPSSACSFTFSSDDEEPVAPHCPQPGVTPPIAIPHVHRRPAPRPASPPRTPLPQDLTPVRRDRTRSCPEQMCSRAPPRTPIPRFPPTIMPTITPSHGRTCSMPATAPDGMPLLTPPPDCRTSATAPRASRDALVDLTEDGGPSNGHRRRVLVLALPDLVVDTEGRDTGACTPPSSHPSTSATTHLSPRIRVSRLNWQRPRALSCDVTLEEELGRELRRIADSFPLGAPDDVDDEGYEDNGTVWGRLRNRFR